MYIPFKRKPSAVSIVEGGVIVGDESSQVTFRSLSVSLDVKVMYPGWLALMMLFIQDVYCVTLV